MIEINYFYNIGYRCTTPRFMEKYGYRKISGPFDYLCIDIETAFENINSKFEKYLSDIVFISKVNRKIKLFHSTQSIADSVNKFYSNNKIKYMKKNYNKANIFINQNFIKNTPYNLYEWERICMFLHHDLSNNDIVKTIRGRSNIFKNIYEKHFDRLCLLYITKIIEVDNLEDYKQFIFNLKDRYDIKCYIIIIVCSDRLNETSEFKNNVLFIVKRVDDLETQSNDKLGTENNIIDDNYEKENNTIRKYFSFNLKKYDEIINAHKNI